MVKWFLRRRFLKFGHGIFDISLLSPLEKDHGYSFVQTLIHFTQECFVSIWFEIGQVVVEKKIFKFGQCFFAISLLSPIEKDHGRSFVQTLIHFTQGCFVPIWMKLAQWVLRRRSLNLVNVFLLFHYYFKKVYANLCISFKIIHNKVHISINKCK